MLTTLILILAAILFVYFWRYPQFGHVLFRLSNAIEARLAGLENATYDLEGITHHCLQSPKSDKPVMLMIHGFSADKSVWIRLARHFRDDYRVVIPDLAGHGETGFEPDWDYGIAEQTKRMVALIQQLSDQPVHLLGNSMGGFISAFLAAHYPQFVASVTLINTAGLKSPKPSPMNLMVAQGQNPFLMDSSDQFTRFFQMTMARPPFVPGIVKRAVALQYVQRKSQLAQMFSDFNRIEDMLTDKLHLIQRPTLVLWGEQDQLIDVSVAPIWQQGTNGQLVIWPDLGHMPMVEAPKRTYLTIRDFLDAHR